MLKNGGVSLFPAVKLLLPTLAKAERRAASFILEHGSELPGLTLTEFAERSGSSQASILRLCKTLGLDGYKRLKAELAYQVRGSVAEEMFKGDASPNSRSGVMAEALKEVFSVNVQILRDTFSLFTDQYEQALQAILGARQLAFFSIGNASMPCQYAYMMFRRIGYYCSANTDPDLQMIDAANLERGDVAIAVSHTGQTRNVVAAMELARARGAVTVCITKHLRSSLTKTSDICIYTATADVSQHMEVVARRIGEYAILEAFYHAVRTVRMETEDLVRKTSVAMRVNKLPGKPGVFRTGETAAFTKK
ncbi:MAG: MurR/RpiR family transcriptional regulator [Planctomycetota bacterium]|jgi:DNA-binding MurR/RpiR family transcriptional regulator|nr:MurR/RpiR family transcriptional regulator [Planctomycetota bacterium]